MHSKPLFKITISLTAAFLAVLLLLILTRSSYAFEPELQTVWPPRNAVTATLNTTITLTYDDPISATTVTSPDCMPCTTKVWLVTETLGVIQGNTLIVTPARPFHQGELVYAIATTRTLDITGTAPLSTTQWQFNAGLVTNRSVSGFSEVYTDTLTGVSSSSVAWGDYDNDDDLDILLTGNASGSRISRVYQNTGSDFTQAYILTGVYFSSVAWGDYDNDGDLDVLLTGYDGSYSIAKIYQNTGSGFSEVYAGSLTGVADGSVAWGDYDNDGDLDILLTGYADTGCTSRVYQNTGSGFSEAYSLAGVDYSSVAWGDYDNDGDLDILLTGDTGSDRISKVYQNTGIDFSEVYTLTGVYRGSVAWGDYDNDGDLDILLTGDISSSPVSKIYRNDGVPTAVTLASFTATPQEGSILIAWETAMEIDTVGFNVWRSETRDGGYVQVNDTLIPSASPGGVWGSGYSYVDSDVIPGTTYYYRLEELEVGGGRDWYGPVSTDGGSPTSVILLKATAGRTGFAALAWWLAGTVVVVGAGLVTARWIRKRTARAG